MSWKFFINTYDQRENELTRRLKTMMRKFKKSRILEDCKWKVAIRTFNDVRRTWVNQKYRKRSHKHGLNIFIVWIIKNDQDIYLIKWIYNQLLLSFISCFVFNCASITSLNKFESLNNQFFFSKYMSRI